MGFQKKGNAKARQAPKKNKVELNDDLDYESDSNQTVKKTPKTPDAKTPKRKQLQSNEKVCFQTPGKNTPVKTLKNKNSVVGKKKTPAKMSSREFEGVQTKVQKNRKQERQSLDQAEEDDEKDMDSLDMLVFGDEDDDDDEMDIDDLDMVMGKDVDNADEEEDADEEVEDDDEEEDADEEVEDDDEEEDDEEEENDTSNFPAKQAEIKTSPLRKNITPVKNSEKSSNIKGDKIPVSSEDIKADKTPSNNSENRIISPSPKNVPLNKENLEALKIEYERIERDRKRKMLFIGFFPNDVTAAELKALSTDIIDIKMKSQGKNGMKSAFLQFDSELRADENYYSLKKKELRNLPVSVDYVGEKSKNIINTGGKVQINFKKLNIDSLPADSTIAHIAGFFPKAFHISICHHDLYKSAYIYYLDEESGAADFEACKSAVLDGKSLEVTYSHYNVVPDWKSKKRSYPSPLHSNRFGRTFTPERYQNPKRMKFQE